jgi:apolipoprotein N-acyltransferase
VQEEGLRIARMRALESSRFFARAMKEGTSAVINPLGQVIVRPKKNLDIGTLEAEVKLLQTKTLYSRYGDGAVLLFLFMSIALPFYCCGRSQDDD